MYGILVAFKNYKFNLGIMDSPWIDPLFSNFSRFFSSYWFPIILKNTVLISLLSLVIGFPIPIILALMTNEIGNQRIKKTFQTVSYAPHFISVVVVCGMINMFLSPTSGVINKVIEMLGGEPIYFMQKSHSFKWIYVISGVWQDMGWCAIIYFAALSGVSKELLEAAQIDGTTRLQRIWYINIPVLIPTIVVLLILQSGSILSVGYEKVYLLQTDTNLAGSEVISTYVYKMGLIKSDFSFSTAVGLFNSFVNCIILVLANFLAKKTSDTSLW
jgi:putative aldouronate transport system permease protein